MLPKIHLELLENFDQSDKFQQKIQVLAFKSNNIFMTYDWLSSWWQTYQSEHQLFLFVAYQDQQLKAIAPLVLPKDSQSKLKTLKFLGYNLSGNLEILTDGYPVLALSEILKEITHSDYPWQAIFLERLPAAWHHLSFIIRHLRVLKTWAAQREDLACPFEPLKGNFDLFLNSHFNSKSRQTMRRKLKLLEKEGKLQTEWFEQAGSSEIDRILSRMASVEARSWKAETKVGIFQDPKKKEFFSQALKNFAQQKWLEVGFFKLDDLDIAFFLGFIFRERYFLYSTAYDQAFAKFSPGEHIIIDSLARAFDKKCHEYNLLRGNDEYKFRIGHLVRIGSHLHIYKPTIQNFPHFLDEKYLRPIVRTLKKSLINSSLISPSKKSPSFNKPEKIDIIK